jgi:NAD(P) transhydrogenase
MGIFAFRINSKGILNLIGHSYYNKIACARIQMDKNTGLLKLIFDKKTKVILGVHII